MSIVGRENIAPNESNDFPVSNNMHQWHRTANHFVLDVTALINDDAKESKDLPSKSVPSMLK